jgi:hypothetical protein
MQEGKYPFGVLAVCGPGSWNYPHMKRGGDSSRSDPSINPMPAQPRPVRGFFMSIRCLHRFGAGSG